MLSSARKLIVMVFLLLVAGFRAPRTLADKLRASFEPEEACAERRKDSDKRSSPFLFSWFIRPIHAVIRSAGCIPRQVRTRGLDIPGSRSIRVWASGSPAGRTLASLLGLLVLLSVVFLMRSHGHHGDGEPFLPDLPIVEQVVVDDIDLDEHEPFDISIPTVNAPGPWSYFKWCWAGLYWDGYWHLDDILTAVDHIRFARYVNYWKQKYYEAGDSYEYYQCLIISHGDGTHVLDPPLDDEDAQWAEVWFWPGNDAPGGGWYEPQAWVTDSDGNMYYVPVIMNGISFPAGADGIHYGF